MKLHGETWLLLQEPEGGEVDTVAARTTRSRWKNTQKAVEEDELAKLRSE